MTDMIPNATHITEFVPNSAGGTWRGTCGETSLAVAMGASGGFAVTPQQIDTITHDLINKGWAEANGASYMNTLMEYAREQGYDVLYEHDYAGDQWDINTWHPLLLQYAGVAPIVLNIARGGNLVDAETGAADERGVQYHVICVLGKNVNGYICNDGDNWQVGQRFQVYSLQTLANALPCGMGVLAMKQGTGGHTMPLPQGFTDDGKTITAPNGNTITEGFADYCRANPAWLQAAGLPLDNGYPVSEVGMDTTHGPGSEQLFQFAGLCWTQSDGIVRPLWVGAMVQALRQQTPTPVPQPTPLTDAEKNAIALVAAMKAALA